jgi:SsrA-binding protein
MAKKTKQQEAPKGPATILNRKARYDYEIVETHEAGIALQGPEVKSVFLGNVQLLDGFCIITNGELWLHGVYIQPYERLGYAKVEVRRPIKLLMHRAEIKRLDAKAKEKGFTIIPLKMYFTRGRAKVEIGLGRGKRQYDKRDAIAAKDERRRSQRGQD